uniref:RanBP-type and C3HC4-type zinc finger-containing protein 1 n=1 Tax=Mola mola TaxID=94237 RepID=A0A3Q3W7K6_MOLML
SHLVTRGLRFLPAAEALALSLGEALSSGDAQEAASLCQRLSQLSVPVSVSVGSQAYPQDPLRLWVGVEDAQSDNYIPVTVLVSPHMTIAQLKDKISLDFGFAPSLQRWVIGKRLAQDRETLFSHGICHNGDKAFLFILSACANHLTRHQLRLDQDQQRIEGPYLAHTASPLETPPPLPPKPWPFGWACTSCTFLNKPTRPGCEMCGGERPQDYVVPHVYQPDQWVRRMEKQSMTLKQRNYMHFLAVEDQNLIPNSTETDCPICFSSLQPGEGVVLRECLHTFCRDCLKGTIVNSLDAEVSCPEACESKLLDREIKVLLTEEELQRFMELRLSIAESRSEHSFHCQTPNCRGWCIYEDEVDEFHCELCSENNCILCRAIHKDMNCKDYQDDLRIRAENDQAAQQTRQMLERLLQSGEAMKCPRCDVIVQKKDGCDWICCLMCKTEICWVTKQARWGPNGRGDTSGGCRCQVGHKPCHPNCQNCH